MLKSRVHINKVIHHDSLFFLSLIFVLYHKLLNSQYYHHQLNLQKSFFSTSTSNLQQNLTSNRETANVEYVNGLVKVILKLPARGGELCEFNLKLLNDNVGTLIENLLIEDKSIEKAQVFTLNGVRIAQSTPISAIVLAPFLIKINDVTYTLEPPSAFAKDPNNDLELLAQNDLENVKKLVSKLYLHLNVEQFEDKREQEIVKELELLKMELHPLEQVKN